ncbi:hypothetical protein DIPPA_64605 [Diplonema papillatum]|nr:hypothetical protein DIPPA_64605 [Diplonema papillatum]
MADRAWSYRLPPVKPPDSSRKEVPTPATIVHTEANSELAKFDVEYRLVLQCLGRLRQKWSSHQPTNTPPVPLRRAVAVKAAEEEVTDDFTIEVSIIRRSLLSMRRLAKESASYLHPAAERAEQLESAASSLLAENKHLQQLLLQKIHGSETPHGSFGRVDNVCRVQNSSPCVSMRVNTVSTLLNQLRVHDAPRAENIDGVTPVSQGSIQLPRNRGTHSALEPRSPTDAHSRQFRAKNQECFWAHVVRHLQHGKGDYDFMIDTTNSLYYRRLAFSREAAMYGVDPLSDAVFQLTKPSLVIRRLLPGEYHRPPQRLLPTSQRHRGVISFLGTNRLQTEFRNPAEGDIKVMVACSSTWGHSDPASLVDEKVTYFCTRNKEQQWVAVDFIDLVIIPHSYSFVSLHPILSGYYPRSWVLEASLDGRKWSILKSHVNDSSVTKQTPCALWKIGHCEEHLDVLGNEVAQSTPPSSALPDPFEDLQRSYYRHFRLRQTGPNSFGTDELQVTSIEIYGEVLAVAPFIPPPPPIRVKPHNFDTHWNEHWTLPADKGKVKGEKKKR